MATITNLATFLENVGITGITDEYGHHVYKAGEYGPHLVVSANGDNTFTVTTWTHYDGDGIVRIPDGKAATVLLFVNDWWHGEAGDLDAKQQASLS
jgi:hypothetical protein